jgi:ribosome-associated translation inhibitor RaiA
MSRSDFHFEFNNEVPYLDNTLITETEKRLRALGEGHNDLVGAAVAMEELAQEKTPHIYQARVVAYIRPENIAAVEKADTPSLALTEAVSAVERQIRERRSKLRERWEQPEHVTDQGVYELSAEEIYDTFVGQATPSDLLAMERTALATQLMVENNLEEVAAFYAVDQILAFAQEILDTEQTGAEAERRDNQRDEEGILAVEKEFFEQNEK